MHHYMVENTAAWHEERYICRHSSLFGKKKKSSINIVLSYALGCVFENIDFAFFSLVYLPDQEECEQLNLQPLTCSGLVRVANWNRSVCESQNFPLAEGSADSIQAWNRELKKAFAFGQRPEWVFTNRHLLDNFVPGV